MYHLHKPSCTPSPCTIFSFVDNIPTHDFPSPISFLTIVTTIELQYVVAILQYTTFVLLRSWFTLRLFVGSILQRCKCIRVFHGIYKPPQPLTQYSITKFEKMATIVNFGKQNIQVTKTSTLFLDASEYAYSVLCKLLAFTKLVGSKKVCSFLEKQLNLLYYFVCIQKWEE